MHRWPLTTGIFVLALAAALLAPTLMTEPVMVRTEPVITDTVPIQAKSPIGLFKSGAPTHRIVLLDQSESMAGPKLQAAVEAASGLLVNHRAIDDVTLVTFGEGARVIADTRWLDGYDSQNHIRTVRAYGASDLSAGLMQAEHIAGSSQKQVELILLTDGRPNAGILHPDQLAAWVQRISATFTGVGIGSEADGYMLERMAGREGSRVLFVAQPRDLADAVRLAR